jgi:hypothetical protein
MRLVRVFVVVAVLLALATGAEAAGKAKKAKKKGHPVQGTVTAVVKDTITVEVKANKKQGGGATERKFQLNDATKYETLTTTRVKGQKPQKDTKNATFDDVKAGAHVRITPNGTAAEKVTIVAKGKKKKAN